VFKVPLSVSNLFSILFGNSSEPLNIFSSYFFFGMMVSLFILIIFHTAYYFQVSLLVYYLQEPRCLKPEAVTVITNEDVRINQYRAVSEF
jgi:hypothetical protein